MNDEFKTRNDSTIHNVISFHELSPQWKAEAISNLDDQAEEAWYFEPDEGQTPAKHILWDLTQCMRVDDPTMDGIIGISNGSAMAVKFSDCGEIAETWFLG